MSSLCLPRVRGELASCRVLSDCALVDLLGTVIEDRHWKHAKEDSPEGCVHAMMGWESERLDLAGCGQLLGISPVSIRRAVRSGGFPDPNAIGLDGQAYWSAEIVYRWAARLMPHLADRIPANCWPASTVPADFLGSRPVSTSATALGWRTPLGEVWLTWGHAVAVDMPSLDRDEKLTQALAVFPAAAAVIVVGPDFGLTGQALWATLPGAPGRGQYEIEWLELSEVLGQPVPFWAAALRIPELLRGWRPGSPATVAAAVPLLDVTPVLRLATIVDPDSPAQKMLINLAQVWQSRTTDDARQDLKIARRHARPGTMTVAAVPVDVPKVSRSDLDESVRRAGWLEILLRKDNLAVACVRQKMMWDSGNDLPAGNPETIDMTSAFGQEWARRLVPAPRTAATEVLDPRGSAVEVLVDPETDAVAVRHDDGRLRAAIPQRLPATSPLAQLILDRPIWVRTEDGTIYPAPKDHYFGLSWGYSGSGPAALAILAERLLSDINAVAADTIVGAPQGLQRLIAKKWDRGTILTRTQLEAARDEGPAHEMGD